MCLTLMVRFVPSQHAKPLIVCPLSVRCGLAGQLGIGQGPEVVEHRLTPLGEIFADRGDRGNIVVGRAASGKASYKICGCRLTATHANVQVTIVGCSDMHKLPGYMGTSGTRPPGQDGWRIRPSGNRIEQAISPLA